MLNICYKITKPEPVYAYKLHAYKKKTSIAFVGDTLSRNIYLVLFMSKVYFSGDLYKLGD